MEIDWNQLLRDCARSSSSASQILENFSWPTLELRSHLAPQVYRKEAYSRYPLAVSPQGEIILMRWKQDQFCAPHDHGSSSGYVFLLEGNFIEREWFWESNRLVLGECQSFVAPRLVQVDSRRIHDMKTTNGGTSIHLYFPPIHRMRVFDCDRQETLIVSDDCGAWIPEEQRLILARTTWSRV